MTLRIVPCRPPDVATLRRVLAHPSLASEFDLLQNDEAVNEMLGDPYAIDGLRWLAYAGDEPVGFSFGYLPESNGEPWAIVRIGVAAPCRRRGIGSALLAAAASHLESLGAAGPRELCVSAWEPSPEADAFAAAHGFARARRFWRMDRPRAPVSAPGWPAGVEVRTFDGSDQALADFNEAYNRAFAAHYHYVRSSLEHTRRLLRQSHFRPDGLALAYRDGRCVGFCRNALFGRTGEVALLGTVPEARGIGLGRALLRWGVAWLERATVERLDLLVDGGNEGALRLYRSEGFVVARTRSIWSRRAGG